MPKNNSVNLAIKGWQQALYSKFSQECYPPKHSVEDAFKKGVEYAVRAFIGEAKK